VQQVEVLAGRFTSQSREIAVLLLCNVVRRFGPEGAEDVGALLLAERSARECRRYPGYDLAYPNEAESAVFAVVEDGISYQLCVSIHQLHDALRQPSLKQDLVHEPALMRGHGSGLPHHDVTLRLPSVIVKNDHGMMHINLPSAPEH
jgi:hypothetical protein